MVLPPARVPFPPPGLVQNGIGSFRAIPLTEKQTTTGEDTTSLTGVMRQIYDVSVSGGRDVPAAAQFVDL